MKKILYVLCMLIGGLLLLGNLLQIPNTILLMIATNRIAYGLGYLTGYLVFGMIGFLLIRFGYRKFNPKRKKEKVSIDDLGKD